MVQIISGKKGKGKTKYLLDKVNASIGGAEGSVVYLDKSAKHMYEVSNKVRLIDVSEYPVASYEGFIGFLCGIISQDNDLQQMYLDSFLKLACLEGCDLTEAVETLETLSARYAVDFILSVSCDEEELSESVKSKVIISL